MTKAKISEYDAVASNNTDVNGVNIAEGCPPSGMNNMGREIMAALKRFQVGSDGDGVTVGGNLVVSGSVEGGLVVNDSGAAVDFRVEGDTDANLLFVDASTDRVGIGTNAPSTKLELSANDSVAVRLTSTDTGMTADEVIGSIEFFGSDASSAGAGVKSSIVATAQGTGGAASDLRFHTSPGSTNNDERMRITNGGFLKASNTGSYVGVANSYHELTNDASGNQIALLSSSAANPYGLTLDFLSADPNNTTNWVFKARYGATNIYTIWSNGTVSARSDAKWKKNIETARDGYVDDLARLRIVKYNWYNHEDGTPKEMGLIAQEVEEVFPGLVQSEEETRDEVRTRDIPAVLDEDGNEIEPAKTEEYTEQVGTGEYTKSIKFSVFTPMLIKAVQELKTITDTQAQTIAALEARIAALENA